MDSGKLIGLISARLDPIEQSKVEIGFSIHHDYWCRGHAAEAGRVIMDFCKKHLPVKSFIAHAVEANTALHVVPMKLGFKDEGVIPIPKEI